MLNVDAILQAMNDHAVDCILIGGMNFLLNHQPILTYDVDLWLKSTPENRTALNQALRSLGAQWGATEQSWGPVPEHPAWLSRQNVYCFTTTVGALDIFFEVRGLEDRYEECHAVALAKFTQAGTLYLSLADQHMLACQEALGENERKKQRVEILKTALSRRPTEQ